MADFLNNSQEVRITDEQGNYGKIDSTGHQVIGGDAPVGNAPSGNPVTIAGVDKDGLKRYLKLSASGSINVFLGANLNNRTIQILHNQAYSAVNSDEWQEVLGYTIPMGYSFSPISFEGETQFAYEEARAATKIIMGTLNGPTDTFTDGSSWTLPTYATELFVHVKTAVGTSLNDTITITYTNGNNVAGRTAVVTVPKSSLAGTRLRVPLQAGDFSIIDITNVTHSATGQAGLFEFDSISELFHITMSSTNTQYSASSVSLGGLNVTEGSTIFLEFLSRTKTTYKRRISLVGTLVPNT